MEEENVETDSLETDSIKALETSNSSRKIRVFSTNMVGLKMAIATVDKEEAEKLLKLRDTMI